MKRVLASFSFTCKKFCLLLSVYFSCKEVANKIVKVPDYSPLTMLDYNVRNEKWHWKYSCFIQILFLYKNSIWIKEYFREIAYL